MNSADRQVVLHCLKAMIDEALCEECPLYGTTGTDHCEKDCVRLAIKALEQEPNKWIPVWERLPEERGVYLVTQKAIFPGHVFRRIVGYAPNLHDVDEYDFADKKRPGWYEYDSEWGYRELDDVIAWMPLVEPYKAESEDEE